MSAWYVFSSIGLYPFNPASGIYEIGSPIFERTTLNVANGKTFVITAKNVSDSNRFIQSARLNGENFNRQHFLIRRLWMEGLIVLVMGPEPNT